MSDEQAIQTAVAGLADAMDNRDARVALDALCRGWRLPRMSSGYTLTAEPRSRGSTRLSSPAAPSPGLSHGSARPW